MEEKKRKNKGEKSARHAMNYEDILNDFARGKDDDPNSSEDSRTDLDGFALAQLLGETVPAPPADGAASGHYDAIGASDYPELARQFEELDLSELATDDDAAEYIAPMILAVDDDLSGFTAEMKRDDDELALEDSEGYAALLDQLENEVNTELSAAPASGEPEYKPIPVEEQAEPDPVDWELLLETEPQEPADTPSRTEVLSIVNLAESMDEPPSEPLIEENADTPAAEPLASESEELGLSDLFTDKLETTEVQIGEPSTLAVKVPAASPREASGPEMDFMGLTSLSPQENRAEEKPARRMEVLFEGVEMNFEDQTDEVTLAELLLSQGEKTKAADIFQYVSQNKGTTFWVAKRLRSLAASAEKQ